MLCAAVALHVQPLCAATYWQTEPASGSWNNGVNWTDGLPSSTTPAYFSTSTVTTTTHDGDKNAQGVFFVDQGSGIGNFTVNTGSGGVLYVYDAGVVAEGGNQTFNAQVRPRTTATIVNSGTGLLNFANVLHVHLLADGSATITFDGSGDTRVNRFSRRTSAMEIDIVKQGSGTLTIAGATANAAGPDAEGAINGPMSILGGTVAINNEANLGANLPAFNAAGLLLNGGALRATASFAIDDSNRGLTLGASGGTFDVPDATHTLTIANPITGPGVLTKVGAGTLTLSGNNTMGSGTLTFGSGTENRGALRLASADALGGYSTIHLPANNAGQSRIELTGGIAFNAYDITTLGRHSQQTTGATLVNISGNNIWNGDISITGTGGGYGIRSDAGTLTLNGRLDRTLSSNDTRNWELGGAGNIVVHGLITQSSAQGNVGLAKFGAGTLTLTAANTYGAGTTISGGTLRLQGGDNRLPTGTAVQFGGSGTLDLDAGQAIHSVTFANGVTAAVAGGGSLAVNGAAHLEIGPHQTGNTGATSIGAVTLNMSNLGTFSYQAPGHIFRVGLRPGTQGAYASSTTVATATLAGTNTITAAELRVGDVAANSGGGQSLLYLGQENTINANTILVAASGRSSATLAFAPGLTSPSAVFRGTNGTSAVSTWNIGRTDNFTNNTWSAGVDFSAGTLDALVGNMTIGNASDRHATAAGSFAMGAGVLNVSGTLTLGAVGGSQDGTRAGQGVFTLNGGAATVGTLNMANHTATAGTASTTGTLTILGGSFAVAGNVADGGGTSTVNLDHGTMNVGGDFSVDNLRVGFVQGAGTATASLTVGSGSTVRIGNGSGTLTIARMQDTPNPDSQTATGTVDLSLASSTTIDVGEVRMGTGNQRGVQHGTLLLGGTTMLIANTLRMADAETGSTPGGRTATLRLGQTNHFSVDTWTIGGRKSSAAVNFNAGVTNGVLNLSGNNNAAANLLIGANFTDTGVAATSTMDLSGGTFNAVLDTLRIGYFNVGSGNAKGSLIMDAGTVTANEVILAQTSGSNRPATEGTLTLRGGTFAVAGNVTDGGGTSMINLANNAVFEAAGNIVADTLQVGVNSSVDGSDATLRLTGTTAQIGSPSNKTDLYVGRRTAETAAIYQGTLDATAVTDLTMHLGEFGLGIGPGSASAQGRPGGTVLLATNNTIEADTITLAHSVSVGLGNRTSRLALGSGTNTIMANSITVGGSKGTGVLDFQAPGGTLNLGSGLNRVNLTIGNQSTWTGGGSDGMVDLSGGTVHAFLGEMVVGSKAGDASGTTRGTFTMAGGVVDANTVILGRREDTGGVGAIHSTLNLQGGWLKAGSIAGSPVNPNTANDQLNFNWTGGRLSVDHFAFDLLQTSTAGPSVLAPGRSIGTTSIDGNYTMDIGTLEIEIAGTGTGGIDYDFVTVDGDASLAGWLDVSLLGGFTAQLGDYFDVLTTTGTLDIGGLALTGDAPNPVFGWWEIGIVPGPASGATLRLSAVPEPGTWLLLLAAAACGVLFRRRR